MVNVNRCFNLHYVMLSSILTIISTAIGDPNGVEMLIEACNETEEKIYEYLFKAVENGNISVAFCINFCHIFMSKAMFDSGFP